MEKLQAAIEKAKQKRRALEAETPPAGAPASADARTPVPAAAADALPDPVPATEPVMAPADPAPTPPPAPEPPQSKAAPEPVAEASRPPSRDELDQAWATLTLHKPAPRILRRHRILPPGEPGDEAAPYDMLRTRILHRMRKEGWRRLLITSPGASCGKSTVAANLAVSVARNPELRVILFDNDLRRPALGQMFGVKHDSSFHEVLSGQALFEDHALRLGTNMALTTNQTTTRNPAELLQSDHAKAVFDTIERRYMPDLMIFDMPPLLGSDDTHAFLPQADCALLLAAAESTTIEQIDAAEKDLAQHLPVLGVTLTKCRYTDRAYGYNTY